MANIKQQRKRVKIAARQRLENLRYKSRIKTMFKSLTVAAQEDKEKASQMGLELISVIDKAASRGIIHANAASHKKSRVTSIVELAEGNGKPKGPATKEAKDGKSKKDRRAERHAGKAEREAADKAKQKVKAAAQAEAAKAEAEKKAADAAAAKEAAAAEKAAADAAAAEAAEEAPAAEAESAEGSPEVAEPEAPEADAAEADKAEAEAE